MSSSATHDFDVVIIGGGPGGLACAEVLLNKGLRVLLVEKNRRIGPKTCAGILTNLMPTDLIPPDAIRLTQQVLKINGRPFRIPLAQAQFSVSRETLGAFQLSRISNHPGLTLSVGVTAEIVDRYTVVVNGRSVKTAFIVGADGVHSTVRKFLGLPMDQLLAITQEVESSREDLELAITPKLPGNGYLWATPHEGHVNTGIYFDPERLRPQVAKQLLAESVQSDYPLARSRRMSGAWVPIRYVGVEHGNIYLIGDAAGLALKTNGEGISTAVISGREVARHLLDPSYGMPELARILRVKRKQERLLEILERSRSGRDALLRLYATLKGFRLAQRFLTS
jgi:geranylgeranyl reductase